jgi:hypothetical protein
VLAVGGTFTSIPAEILAETDVMAVRLGDLKGVIAREIETATAFGTSSPGPRSELRGLIA